MLLVPVRTGILDDPYGRADGVVEEVVARLTRAPPCILAVQISLVYLRENLVELVAESREVAIGKSQFMPDRILWIVTQVFRGVTLTSHGPLSLESDEYRPDDEAIKRLIEVVLERSP